MSEVDGIGESAEETGPELGELGWPEGASTPIRPEARPDHLCTASEGAPGAMMPDDTPLWSSSDASAFRSPPEEREFHPVADIFRMMSDREFIDLIDDIREHGLREPVWLHRDGRIIDGRNRYNACRRLGMDPAVRVYEGDDDGLVPFVLSLNLHRRHLDESQRGMVAARIANMRQGERTDIPSGNSQKVSQSDAASMLNVSDWTVSQAKKVQDQGSPALAAAVDAGQVAVSTAATLTELPPKEQRELIDANDEKAIIKKANQIKAEKREVRRQEWEQKRRAAREEGAKAEGGPEVRVGDFVEALADLEDGSVDLILTDPPYGDEALPSYKRLAEFAAAKLKPGGSLVCYTGQSILPGVLESLGGYLRYWWTLSLDHAHGAQQLPGKWVLVEWKPIVWFVRDHRDGRSYVADKVRGTRPDKDAHEWAQGAEEVGYLIESLTEIGSLVVDPFAGSGSFGRAALSLGRRFVGADLDPDSATGTVTA